MTYIKLLPLIIAISFSTSSFSQISFFKTFGGINEDKGYSVIQTSDEGYIITGFSKSFINGYKDIYVLKTNKYGDTLWTKIYAGIGDDNGFNIKQTRENEYILGGTYFMKLDSIGNLVFSKQYSGYGNGYTSIQQTNDNDYLLLNTTSTFGAGNWDIQLIKTNNNGDTLWTKTYGGTNHDNGKTVHETSDNSLIILGETTSYYNGELSAYLIKTNSTGDTLWTRIYNDSTFSYRAIDMCLTNDGGDLILGNSDMGIYELFLIKTNSNGDLIWTKTYSSPNSILANSLVKTLDNGFIIAGSILGTNGDDVLLIRTDSIGNILWSKSYGGPFDDVALSISQSADSSFVITGYTNNFGAGSSDLILIKTDTLGNIECHQSEVAIQTSNKPIQIYSGSQIGNGAIIINSPIVTKRTTTSIENVCDTTLSVFQFNYSNCDFILFPNPNDGKFRISTEKIRIGLIFVKVCNILGEIVYEKMAIINDKGCNIELDHLKNGIYTIIVESEDMVLINKFAILK